MIFKHSSYGRDFLKRSSSSTPRLHSLLRISSIALLTALLLIVLTGCGNASTPPKTASLKDQLHNLRIQLFLPSRNTVTTTLDPVNSFNSVATSLTGALEPLLSQTSSVGSIQDHSIRSQLCSIREYSRSLPMPQGQEVSSTQKTLLENIQTFCDANPGAWKSPLQDVDSSQNSSSTEEKKISSPSKNKKNEHSQKEKQILFLYPALTLSPSQSQFGDLIGGEVPFIKNLPLPSSTSKASTTPNTPQKSHQTRVKSSSLSKSKKTKNQTNPAASEIKPELENPLIPAPSSFLNINPPSGNLERSQIQDGYLYYLHLLQKQGVKIVLMAHRIPDFQPYAFINMAQPSAIGEMQATNLLKKLNIDTSSPVTPRQILIFVGGKTPTSQEFLTGVWKVFKPYFIKGLARDPLLPLSPEQLKALPDEEVINKLVQNSAVNTSEGNIETDSSLRELLEQAQNQQNSVEKFAAQAPEFSGIKPQKIDTVQNNPLVINGVVAANDYIASRLIHVLKQDKYTGTSASVNPGVSIAQIVQTVITQNVLSRLPAPLPKSSLEEARGLSLRAMSPGKQWPVITGFGSIISNLQNITYGKQWITGLLNRQELKKNVINICFTFSPPARPTDSAKKEAFHPILQGSVLSPGLIPIDNSTIKRELVNTGYVEPAIIGL